MSLARWESTNPGSPSPPLRGTFNLALLALGTVCLLSGSASAAEPASAAEHYRVVRKGFSKKVQFEDIATAQTVTMTYKGIPWSRGSAIDLVADPNRYKKSLNRVRYRFVHPLSKQALVLQARSTTHRVRNVPIRSENTAPTVEVLESEASPALASMSYDFHSKTLFSGQVRDRAVEIERVSEDTPLDRGLLKYFLFPFPVTGDYEVRIDGQRVAWFTQGLRKGTKAPYELYLAGDLVPQVREDAMLAFIIFDLMGDFVTGAV